MTPTPTAHRPRLILASSSPQRRRLLAEAGFQFEVHAADIDERDYAAAILPVDLAIELARRKANAVADIFPEGVILGADTIVALRDQILGKPESAKHARQMLELLSGTTHEVVTGVAVVQRSSGSIRSAQVVSQVRMRTLLPAEIEGYVAGGAWRGKAGGYGIQDDDPFVTRIDGCHTNIVGLPMTLTAKLLAEAGIVPGPF